jgi:hypothetical protein
MKKIFIKTVLLLLLKSYVLAQSGNPINVTANDGTVYTFAEHPPTYAGGNKKLSAFLTENVDFSKVTTEMCSYTIAIGKMGELLQVKRLKGIEENESVLLAALNKTNGKWNPGKKNGHPVNVLLTITLELANRQIVATITKPATPRSDSNIVDNQYERGKFKNGSKTGVWEYYDRPGDLALKINYTNAQLLYLKPDTSWYAIKINDVWETVKLDAYPRYIGTMNDFSKIFDDFHAPPAARDKNTIGEFYITFEVDTLGQAGNYGVLNDLGYNWADSIAARLQSLPNYWLVAKKNGKSYESKFIIPVTFSVVDGSFDLISEKKKTLAIPPVAKQLTFIHLKAVLRSERVRGW